MGVVKPKNQFLKAQSTLGSRGESMFEAAPQFCLQCYIVLLNWKPLGWKKWASLVTSALTLSLTNIEHYVTSRLEEKKVETKNEEFEVTLKVKMQYPKNPQEQKFKPELNCLKNLATNTFEEFYPQSSIEFTSRGLTSMKLTSIELKSKDTYGLMSVLENIAVFLPQSLFKILSLVIVLLFFKLTVGFFYVYPYILVICYLKLKGIFMNIEMFECICLSWLTITNLGRGKTAAVCRLVTSIFWTIAHTITITVILVICNTDPGIMGDGQLLPVWSELPLVQDLPALNTLLITIICLGWSSLVLDVITAGVKHHRARDSTKEEEETSIWDGAILFEAWKY